MKLNCCNFNDKILKVEEVFLTNEQINWIFETESTPGEDATKAVEMVVKKYKILHIFIWENSNRVWEDWLQFLKNSTMGKILSNGIAGYREMVRERKNQCMWLTLLSYFKKITTAISTFSNEYPD